MCLSHDIPSISNVESCWTSMYYHYKVGNASQQVPHGAFLHLTPPFSLSLNVADGASKRTASCPLEAPLSITTPGSPSPPDEMGSQKVPTRFRSCAEEEELAESPLRKSGTAPAKMRSERMPSHETLLNSMSVSWTTVLAMPSPLICGKS